MGYEYEVVRVMGHRLQLEGDFGFGERRPTCMDQLVDGWYILTWDTGMAAGSSNLSCALFGPYRQSVDAERDLEVLCATDLVVAA